MKKWFKRKGGRGEAPAGEAAAPAAGASNAAPPPAPPPPPRRGEPSPFDDSGSEYTDDSGDEPVHDFEIAQEDYLVRQGVARRREAAAAQHARVMRACC